jgi:hypothetical protein
MSLKQAIRDNVDPSARILTDEWSGYRGIGKDITESKQARQRQAIEHAVAQYLSDADNLAEAMPRIIRAFCATMGWDYGARWEHREDDQSFVCAELWCRPPLEDSHFLSMTRSKRFMPGPAGLVRRVLAQREPHWITDMASEDGMVRGAAAQEAGLNAAFAFPIITGNRLVGVVEFFAQRIWEPDFAITDTARSDRPVHRAQASGGALSRAGRKRKRHRVHARPQRQRDLN